MRNNINGAGAGVRTIVFRKHSQSKNASVLKLCVSPPKGTRYATAPIEDDRLVIELNQRLETVRNKTTTLVHTVGLKIPTIGAGQTHHMRSGTTFQRSVSSKTHRVSEEKTYTEYERIGGAEGQVGMTL